MSKKPNRKPSPAAAALTPDQRDERGIVEPGTYQKFKTTIPALARPGMRVGLPNHDAGCGIIYGMTRDICLVQMASGRVNACTWDEVSLDEVRPDPDYLDSGLAEPKPNSETPAVYSPGFHLLLAKRLSVVMTEVRVMEQGTASDESKMYEAMGQKLAEVYDKLIRLAGELHLLNAKPTQDEWVRVELKAA